MAIDSEERWIGTVAERFMWTAFTVGLISLLLLSLVLIVEGLDRWYFASHPSTIAIAADTTPARAGLAPVGLPTYRRHLN